MKEESEKKEEPEKEPAADAVMKDEPEKDSVDDRVALDTNGTSSETAKTEVTENADVKTEVTGNAESSTVSASTKTAPSAPPPVLRGTLSYNAEPRQHLIRGMWNYENSNAFP